jgi:hypothetical protein
MSDGYHFASWFNTQAKANPIRNKYQYLKNPKTISNFQHIFSYIVKVVSNGGQYNLQLMKQHGDVQARPGNIALHLKTGKKYQHCLSCNKNLLILSYSSCLTNSYPFPFHTCCLPANINLRLDLLLLVGDIEENPGPGNMVLVSHWRR